MRSCCGGEKGKARGREGRDHGCSGDVASTGWAWPSSAWMRQGAAGQIGEELGMAEAGEARPRRRRQGGSGGEHNGSSDGGLNHGLGTHGIADAGEG
ncbi:hypothetical protein M0R45_006831 [Rubus argutus]|uniref:Uncharacterized protein n=1 Tax=Rubus argutus TaxID=59490 RepID=A0AAW1YS21_RUBAR